MRVVLSVYALRCVVLLCRLGDMRWVGLQLNMLGDYLSSFYSLLEQYLMNIGLSHVLLFYKSVACTFVCAGRGNGGEVQEQV